MDRELWPLTEREQKVLRYLEHYLRERGTAPAYREVQEHFGFKSIHSVQKYFRRLEEKGYVRTGAPHSKRSLVVLQSAEALKNHYEQNIHGESHTHVTALELPLLGGVAAGIPLEKHTFDEKMEVPRSWVRKPENSFILQVEGASMVDDGIFDGDFLIIQEQKLASNGEIVVAVVDQEATVKRFYLHSPEALKKAGHDPTKSLELRPSNKEMKSLWYSPEHVEIRGVLVGLLRRF